MRSFPSLSLASHISTDSSSLHFFRNLDQAFDRAHRLGQTRDVEIYKLAIEESVEDRILELQDKKRELAAAALSGDKFKAGNKLGLEDIMALFKVSPVRFYLAEVGEGRSPPNSLLLPPTDLSVDLFSPRLALSQPYHGVGNHPEDSDSD